jgi:hypothetical protein
MDVQLGDDTFLFEKLALTPPNGIVGGSYLTKYSYKGSKNQLYIQTPNTQSKQGVIVSGKKAYIDILLTNEHTDFIEWITNLERRSIELLYEKRHLWFTEELDKCDIENSFTPPIRPFKNGQNYLIRVNLELSRIPASNLSPFLCKVFDENRQVVPVEYIKPEQQIISIIEFQGIKFTRRSFQVELYLRQVLVVPSVQLPLFETCVISPIDSARSNVSSKLPSNKENVEVLQIKDDFEPEPEPIKLAISEHLGEDSTITTNSSLNQLMIDNTHLSHNLSESVSSTASTASTASLSNDNTIKHFELAEVDFDFKNIPDAIDVEQPTFDIDNTTNTDANNENAASVTSSTMRTVVTQNQTQTKSNTTTNSKNAGKNGSTGGNLTLKKHKEVIYEMYKVAKRKAQEAKKAAIRAYLEAKEIKATYMLDDLEDSDSGSDSGSDN